MCGTSCPNCRRHFDLTTTDYTDGVGFSTLSESDGTDISSYACSEKSQDTVGASSDSDLLQWFNSQDM